MRRANFAIKWLGGALAAVILLAGSGCQSGTPPGPAAANTPSPQEKERPAERTFGIIYPVAHPFYEMVTRLAEEAAKPYSIQLIVKAPEEMNLEQQIRMMETMIKQKVDGIAIDPIDSEALVPVIDKAVQAGIPVICFESDSPGSKRLSFIGTDNLKAGTHMGEVISRLLKGKGMILVESGLSTMRIYKDRLDGLLRYLNEQTEIQVLEVRYNEGSGERALSDMEAMIDAHPHFDAFVSIDFISALNSVLVWKAKGLSRDAVAFGMMPEIREAIRNGQTTSVISQNEQDWGKWIIEYLLKADEGRNIPAFVDTGVREIGAETN
ncbi:substrate-binding domain-containing protein [Paenibacillus sp. sptzw28]|uniref:sugar ABC transporter substrate-binding protein n=1 Tax=Paenibacillus sp. sptzw28 TaxID=715179 RepID=UPI001C6E4D48|nr:substrate-binding domain-containing protein [Paenibacillus sp. sptzw28]QYR22389.1 substrate-binding domain-containing protein [Paenibacillus sp. sptzw28]